MAGPNGADSTHYYNYYPIYCPTDASRAQLSCSIDSTSVVTDKNDISLKDPNTQRFLTANEVVQMRSKYDGKPWFLGEGKDKRPYYFRKNDFRHVKGRSYLEIAPDRAVCSDDEAQLKREGFVPFEFEMEEEVIKEFVKLTDIKSLNACTVGQTERQDGVKVYRKLQVKISREKAEKVLNALEVAFVMFDENSQPDDKTPQKVREAYELLVELSPGEQRAMCREFVDAISTLHELLKGKENPSTWGALKGQLYLLPFLIVALALANKLAIIGIAFLRRHVKSIAEVEAGSQVAIEEARRKVYERMSANDFLKEFTVDLVDLAMNDGLDPVYGREKAVSEVFEHWLQKGKTSAAITGEAGVGKSALARALAIEIAKAKKGQTSLCPPSLKNMELFELDVMKLVGGTKYRGELEDRVAVLKRAAKQNPRLRKIFIDEGKDNLNAGRSEGGSGVITMLKGDIGKGEFGGLLALTDEDYRDSIAKNAQLKRRFPEVRLEELGPADIKRIVEWAIADQLQTLQATDASFASIRVEFTSEAIARVLEKSPAYFDQAEPDRSMDLSRRILTSAYMNIHRGDASKIQVTANGEKQLVIDQGFVDQVIEEKLKHPEFDKLEREIVIKIRLIANRHRIEKSALGYSDLSALYEGHNEVADVAIRRLRRINNVLDSLLQALNEPFAVESAVNNAMTEVREVLKRKGRDDPKSRLFEEQKSKVVAHFEKLALVDVVFTFETTFLEMKADEKVDAYYRRLDELEIELSKLVKATMSSSSTDEERQTALRRVQNALAGLPIEDPPPPPNPPPSGGGNGVRRDLTLDSVDRDPTAPLAPEAAPGSAPESKVVSLDALADQLPNMKEAFANPAVAEQAILMSVGSEEAKIWKTLIAPDFLPKPASAYEIALRVERFLMLQYGKQQGPKKAHQIFANAQFAVGPETKGPALGVAVFRAATSGLRLKATDVAAERRIANHAVGRFEEKLDELRGKRQGKRDPKLEKAEEARRRQEARRKKAVGIPIL